MAKILPPTPPPARPVPAPAPRQPLPADGAAVENSNYWQRRLAEGAVERLPEQRSETKKGGK